MSKEEKRSLAIKEIFHFYAKQHNIVGTTFDEMRSKTSQLDLGEFMKFCIEFKIPCKKELLMEVFKKTSSKTTQMTYEEFLVALNNISIKINEDRIDFLNNRLKKLNGIGKASPKKTKADYLQVRRMKERFGTRSLLDQQEKAKEINNKNFNSKNSSKEKKNKEFTFTQDNTSGIIQKDSKTNINDGKDKSKIVKDKEGSKNEKTSQNQSENTKNDKSENKNKKEDKNDEKKDSKKNDKQDDKKDEKKDFKKNDKQDDKKDAKKDDKKNDKQDDKKDAKKDDKKETKTVDDKKDNKKDDKKELKKEDKLNSSNMSKSNKSTNSKMSGQNTPKVKENSVKDNKDNKQENDNEISNEIQKEKEKYKVLIMELKAKNFTSMREDLLNFMDLDDNRTYRKKMKGFVLPFHSDKNYRIPISERESSTRKLIDPRTAEEIRRIIQKRKDDKLRDEIEKERLMKLKFAEERKRLAFLNDKSVKEHDRVQIKDGSTYKEIKQKHINFDREKSNKITWDQLEQLNPDYFVTNKDDDFNPQALIGDDVDENDKQFDDLVNKRKPLKEEKGKRGLSNSGRVSGGIRNSTVGSQFSMSGAVSSAKDGIPPAFNNMSNTLKKASEYDKKEENKTKKVLSKIS